MTTDRYLNLREQIRTRNEYFKHLSNEDVKKDIWWMNNGVGIAAILTVPSAVYTFNSSFKAFYLYRYNVSRITILLVALIFGSLAPAGHYWVTNHRMTKNFRSENKWKYFRESIVVQQAAFTYASAACAVLSFIRADQLGLVHVPPEEGRFRYFAKFKYGHQRLIKRFYKPWLLYTMASSVFMGYVATKEFDDSLKVLAKMNRKSLCLDESENTMS